MSVKQPPVIFTTRNILILPEAELPIVELWGSIIERKVIPSMTYLLQPLFTSELVARKEYLFLTYHFFFVEVKKTPDFIELKSFPFRNDNVVMLYGHCPWLLHYFAVYGSELKKKTKIINSCYPNLILSLIKQKNIYYSKVSTTGETYCYDGNKYGISFDITDSELDALNSAHLPLIEQIKFAYKKVA